ncbi:MAG: hypothetical protein LUC18_00925, partial [Porphyromonadaceae bacterium]|nr:hypothetical protein [Porphyromonadaceae bacterium]
MRCRPKGNTALEQKGSLHPKSQDGKPVPLNELWTVTHADNDAAPLGFNSPAYSENKGGNISDKQQENREKSDGINNIYKNDTKGDNSK